MVGHAVTDCSESLNMAIREVHRNDEVAREFSKKLLGRGGFVPYRPPQMPEEPEIAEEQKAKPENKR